jgi:type VII secretion protein EccE
MANGARVPARGGGAARPAPATPRGQGGGPGGGQRGGGQVAPRQGGSRQVEPRQGGSRPPAQRPQQQRNLNQASAHTNPRPGLLGGLLLQQVVLVELAAALIALPFATKRWALAITAPVAIVLLAVAVLRRKQRWLLQYWPVRGEHRRRQHENVAPASSAEPAFAPLLEACPDMRSFTVTSRSRDNVGMIGDGSFLTAVVHVETKDEPLRAPRAAHPLPLSTIAAVLADADSALTSVQIVQHTQTAPATILPSHAMATRSYQQLETDTPALRTTWVALRLDPEQARTAIEARGGGLVGAQRALLRSVHRTISELDLAGFDGVPLPEAELIASLGAACGINPLVGTQLQANPNSRRTRETWRAWRCDDRWHCTFWVKRLPTFTKGGTPDAFALLSGTPTLATTLSLTATATGGGALAFSTHVRVAARSESQLTDATKALEARARKGGFGLVRLDGEQLPGLMATLPLGGMAA